MRLRARRFTGGSAIFVDQAAVRAAVHGRLLVLDGIEKAERNVLPTLNNLLENREMHLDDGRFLMSHTVSHATSSLPRHRHVTLTRAPS